MAYDLNQLQALVGNPSESLSVELKGWLDLKKVQHFAKAAKTLLALRNRNGGFLIFGIDGKTLVADAVNPKPTDVRAAYHTDVDGCALWTIHASITGLLTKKQTEQV